MEPKRVRGWGGWLALAGLTVLPLVLYAGAYYATVRALRLPAAISGRVYHPGEVYPAYRRIPLVNSRWLFAPMHAIDRTIRPQVWNPPSSSAPVNHPAPSGNPPEISN